MIIYDLYDICVSLVYIPSLGFPMNGVSSTFWMIFWLVEILQSRCCAHLCHMQNHDIVWYRDIYNIMINVCEPNLCNWIPLVPHIHTVLLYIDANITVYHYVVYNCDIYIYIHLYKIASLYTYQHVYIIAIMVRNASLPCITVKSLHAFLFCLYV